ncbi:MAG: 3'-5' exonuclease [Oscillospiraceae bacterium]|nr:3'-5' exonuclease [Oscillospiraceae bacterium]
MNRYVAFDVETPNYENNRMSAIGVSVVEDGRIVDEFYSLVNPEARFDRFNIQLTGITPEAAAGAPTFPELWRELEPSLSSGLLIAHNAPFDMSVLAKCLLDYGILWRSTARYACTCQMGRRLLPTLPNHKLNTLCDYLGLELDHHHAGSDSGACAEILLHYLDNGADIRPYIRTYDMLRLCTARASGTAGALPYKKR